LPVPARPLESSPSVAQQLRDAKWQEACFRFSQ
jgi:hypothetical protein